MAASAERFKGLFHSRGSGFSVFFLARIFGLNVETCPDCGGRMKIVAAITDHGSIKRYLDGVGLPWQIPEIKPARPPPRQAFDYADIDYDVDL